MDDIRIEGRDSERLEREEEKRIDVLLREEDDLEKIAQVILEYPFQDIDILKRDSLDKFLDLVILKVRTGNSYIPSLAYPTKRIADKEIEEKIIKLINIHLYPDIIFRILKYFARNIHDSDTNLYLAYLITSDEIITAIYETFLLFKKDIFENDSTKRVINVKRLQQFPLRTGDSFSSPLDAACRFKYILEFIALKQNVKHIYSEKDIYLTQVEI